MILEPLQVMIQLALLSYSPIGTKVSVSNNILHLHQPSMFQGVYRWYNSDGKDDLYYLFHAIRRYYKWYKKEVSEGNNEMEYNIEDTQTTIYNYMLERGIEGINKLIHTYSATEQTSITHTLQLYKNILSLESPDVFKDASDDSINIDTVFRGIKSVYNDNLLEVVYNTLLLMEEAGDADRIQHITGLLHILSPTNNSIRVWIRGKLTC
jgi:hypothetical protein